MLLLDPMAVDENVREFLSTRTVDEIVLPEAGTKGVL